MSRGFRPPMFALAGGLLGLILLLATLQYRWLGQISAAERERMAATLRADAAGFADDFDRELNRAYLLFQIGAATPDDRGPQQMAARYDRWQATARFPRLIKDIYTATQVPDGSVSLRHFNPSTHGAEPAEWPPALTAIRAQIARREAAEQSPQGAVLLRSGVSSVWPDAPALVVPAPVMFFNRLPGAPANVKFTQQLAYTILLLDADYIRGEMLPSLAQHHFQSASAGADYELAVVPTSGGGPVYHSVPEFTPAPTAKTDASADLFSVRVQDFGPLANEISRFFFTTVTTTGPARGQRPYAVGRQTVIRETLTARDGDAPPPPGGGPLSIIVQQSGRRGVATAVSDRLMTTATAEAGTRISLAAAPHWRLLVQHPSGSLEQAVNSVRRRNLLVSGGILGVLAISVGFLVVSTRRAHALARQQLEFVATVSHELRTPLAVIRSAADNLADGVVGDEARVRQYGQLVRREGTRLTDLVEQILEFAGLQSGQRRVARDAVTIPDVLREAAAASAADAVGVRVELSIADDLPSVAGDEAALRRVFLNLIGNAVKYGAAGRWVGVRASASGGRIDVAVSDRGLGIAAAEQEKIFEPFYRTPGVVAAQIQGAGLGLSLVKRIVEAHGGRVRITSAPGQGSTFTVSLPALDGQASADPSGVSDPAPQRS